MEKITLFLCDIYGTFDEKSYENEIVQFVENLNKIMNYNKTSAIIFSFVTTDDYDVVKKMENRIKLYFKESNILIGPHIYSKENKIVNKPSDIIHLIYQLKLNYEIDDRIYYADDCELYHYVLDEIISESKYPYDIHSIIPIESGLSDVNKNLIESFEKVEKKRHK